MGLPEAVAGVLALNAAVRAAMGLLEAAKEALGRIGLRSAYAAAETAPRACCAGLSGGAEPGLLLGWAWCWPWPWPW